MAEAYSNKSTIDEIRARFDADVERFSNLSTGQEATIDAPLSMELLTRAAVASTSDISRVLDLGCGAGNLTIKLRQVLGHSFDAHLLDLSQPMLDRAEQRVAEAGCDRVLTHCGDFRDQTLDEESYDVIVAAAVLHHLRDEADWRTAFEKIFRLLKPGGSFWISDLVTHADPQVHALMWDRYGTYLESLGGGDYRDAVFDYIEKEDSPRPLTFQLDLLRDVGFSSVDVLHKNSCFAAFGGIKER